MSKEELIETIECLRRETKMVQGFLDVAVGWLAEFASHPSTCHTHTKGGLCDCGLIGLLP